MIIFTGAMANVLKGKGGLGPTIFKITIDSKGPHILWRQHSGHDHFPQNRTKSAKNYHIMIYHPSIDNSILSFQKISPIGEKWLSYDQKNVCSNMGMQVILGP